jgi:hypothetical protein
MAQPRQLLHHDLVQFGLPAYRKVLGLEHTMRFKTVSLPAEIAVSPPGRSSAHAGDWSMERTITAWENEGGARQSGEHRGARKAASHRILIDGALYLITIVAVLLIVSRL